MTDARTMVGSFVRSYEPQRDLITAVQNDWGAAMISRYAYESDALGRRDSVLRTGQAFGQTHFDVYDYNPRNELIDSDRYNGADPENPNPMDLVDALCYDWEYDPIGNREQYTDGTNPTTTYTVNDVNQYTATTDPTESFTHDADGTLTHVWNAENRLIEAYPTSPETGNKKLVFSYDFVGRRVRKLTYEWTGTIWSITPTADRRFIYENWLLLLELDGLDSNAVVRKYAWGLDISSTRQGAAGIGGLLAAHDASTSKNYAYFYDANGNVGQLIDTSDGSIAALYEYDPYGGLLATTGIYATINPFRFSTKYYDAETSLYYYGYRYYSPRLGRWMNRDPVGSDGGLNVYAFSANDPCDRTDRLGLTPEALQPKIGCCCCCVEDLYITGVKDIGKITNKGGGRFGSLGNEFTVVGNLKYVKVDKTKKEKPGDCTFEWWEWTDLKPTGAADFGQTVGGWWAAHNAKKARRESPTFKELRDRNHSKINCPGSQTLRAKDNPKIGVHMVNTKRTLHIAVKVSSAKGCKCASKERRLRITQVLHVDMVALHRQFDPNVGSFEGGNGFDGSDPPGF